MKEENIPDVIARSRKADRSLDIGGWNRPINAATHVIDINSYESRLAGQAYDPESQPRFSKETWYQFDICDHKPWPFPDDFFDFSIASHILEDIRDPIWVVSEISRVSKSGYIECPTAASELIKHIRLVFNRGSGTIGISHHRWLVEFSPDSSTITFRLKTHDLEYQGAVVYVTEFHQLKFQDFADGMFWKDKVFAKEEIFDIAQWVRVEALPKARDLVQFRPISRSLDKIRRLMFPSKSTSYRQPSHGDGVKYPYL